MSEIHDDKELKDNLSNCRCCLRLIIDDRKAVDIDETIREQFFNLCSVTVSQLFQILIISTNYLHLLAFKT